MHESVLIYRGSRYLKLALALAAVAIVAYIVDTPAGVPNGGTWLGYTLGTIGALLIVWLMWFGVRKRTFAPGHVKLEDWLSAHVYLGFALIVVATLHTGFQFGLNLHTLAYALMMLVILSGIFGLYAYIRYPKEMTENRRGSTLDQMLQEIADLDQECRDLGVKLSDEINAAVIDAGQNSRVGGGLMRQLSGHDPSCATAAAVARVEALAQTVPNEDTAHVRRLISRLSRKSELLQRARLDVRFKALMQVWLYVHVPISIALVAALIAHIIAVFYYW